MKMQIIFILLLVDFSFPLCSDITFESTCTYTSYCCYDDKRSKCIDCNELNRRKSDNYGKEISKWECEYIDPESIGDCTKHSIYKSEIETINGLKYDKCCFYEVQHGINSCRVLPDDPNFLKKLKEDSKNSKVNYINLIDCSSNFIMVNLIIDLIYIFLNFN
jgi:hypothetical protein